MPRGGARVGAGRKPGKKQAIVLGMNGARRDSLALPPVMQASAGAVRSDETLLEPPADLLAPRQQCWRALAPLAIEAGTLTASKVPGFRELCLRWSYCADLDGRIAELGGAARHESEPLVKRLEKWQQLLNVSLKEFKLTAFGKPELSTKPKTVVNPFAGLA